MLAPSVVHACVREQLNGIRSGGVEGYSVEPVCRSVTGPVGHHSEGQKL